MDSEYVKCPNCGAINPKTNDTCYMCSAKLTSEEPEVEAPKQEHTDKSRPKSSKTPVIMMVIALVAVIFVGIASYNVGKNATRSAISTGLDSELAEKETYASNLNDYIDKKDSYDSEIESMQSNIAALSSQAEAIKKSLVQSGNPIKLPAGHFTVGKDIIAGRYSISGKSNFVVYSDDGSLKVNIVLGAENNELYVTKYVCDLSDGDTIKAEGSDIFTPIT